MRPSHAAPNDDTSLISLVLCCHNGARTVGEQLAALASRTTRAVGARLRQRWLNDDSLAIADSWRDRLPFVPLCTNGGGRPVGLASAKNVGGNAARGDVLLFCDEDDIADPK